MAHTLFAALTGDIVRSTRSGAAPMIRIRTALEDAAQTAQAHWNCVIGGVDVFRGDSWQMLLDTPGRALDAALLLRASLRAECDMDTRVAIGIGPVSEVDAERISRSTGEAFLASGRLLDEMRARRLALASSPASQAHFPWIDVALRLADRLARDWTQRQSELVRLALIHRGLSQAGLGALMRPAVTQQTVGQTLDAAGWPELTPALEAFREARWRE